MIYLDKGALNCSRTRPAGYRETRFLGKALLLDRQERVIPFPSSFLKKVAKQILKIKINLYPNVVNFYNYLEKKIKISKSEFFITEGGTGAIDLLFRAYTKKNKSEVIFLKPNFPLYKVFSKFYSVKAVEVNYNKFFKYKADDIIKKISNKTSIIFLTNPGSPIDFYLDEEQIIKIAKICQKKKIILSIDEVYFQYFKKTSINLIRKFKIIFIIRSFSKSYGLAGLRIGYVVSQKNNIKYLSKFRSGYEVNALTMEVIKLILNNNNLVKKYLKDINRSKKFFKKELTKIGIETIDHNNLNFFILKFKNKALKLKVIKGFLKKNIYVKEVKIKNCILITISSIKDMKKVLFFLKKINKP